MNEHLLTKCYDASGAIAARRIVAMGAQPGAAAQAASATDALFGLADELGAVKGGRCDVHLAGIAPVEAGGVFAAGAWLTADADGKAVAAAVSAPVLHTAWLMAPTPTPTSRSRTSWRPTISAR